VRAMWMTPSAGAIGAGIGFLVGLLFVIAGWRIALILLAFVLVGFLVGLLVEHRRRMLHAIREWFDSLPRS
jgi:uncharacterized membrane protein